MARDSTYHRVGELRQAPIIPQNSTHTGDFWIPQVTPVGQIYYVNTQTGQVSRDLPIDPQDDLSDGDLAGLTSIPSSSRTGATSALGFTSPPDLVGAQSDVHKPPDYSETDLSDQHTPSPVQNKDSVHPSFTAPVQSITQFLVQESPQGRARAQTDTIPTQPSRRDNRVPGVLFDSLTAHLRHRSHSISDRRQSRNVSNSSPQLSHNHSTSITSMQPDLTIPTPQKHALVSKAQSRPRYTPANEQLHDVQERNEAERVALVEGSTQTLQHILSPSSPELVSDLLDHARQSIVAIMAYFGEYGIPQGPSEEDNVDSLIEITITAIRNLLYVSGPPLGHIPHNLSKEGRDRGQTSTASQTLLVPAQRRAIATLSKFVLSARAILNEAPWNMHDGSFHLQNDADELDRSLLDFVSTVERFRNQEFHGGKGLKRLHGNFTVSHIGLGKAGAGAAGSWKGYGWVDIDANEEAPMTSLDRNAFESFKTLVLQLQAKFSAFSDSLRATKAADVIISEAQDIMIELSSLISFVSDLHIARHVDIGPVNQSRLSDGEKYERTVEKARSLVRSFEATIQTLFDDGSSLLMTTQRVRRLELCDVWRGRDESYDVLQALISSLKHHLEVARQVLEYLLHIGQEQADILERDNKSPVEWRMSQLSFADRGMVDALRSIQNDSYDVSVDGGDSGYNSKTIRQSSPDSSLPPPVPSKLPLNTHENILWDPNDDEALGIPRVDTRAGGSKLKALLGPEVPRHYLDTINADAKPFYLRPNYDPSQILIDPDGTVRGGTVPALVERLTAHEYADPKFIKAFLMTYKSFTTTEELFTLLVERFWIQPPENLNASELDDWRKFKQDIIRMRVMNTVKSMVQDEDILDREDMYILDRMQDFMSREEVLKLPAARKILDSVKRAQRGRDKKMAIKTSHQPPPAPIVPKRIDLLDIDPLELARQLTITESQLYLKIKPLECLQRSREQKNDYNDNIANFIRRTNRVGQWVIYAILGRDDSRKRASVMKHFINVADRCRAIKNFSTMMAIMSGLNSSHIRRLKRSWEQVSAKMMSQLETCETTSNSYKNYTNYRSSLAKVTAPCVPFIGVFLTAVTHIQDGSKDSLPGQLVNFRKRQKVSEVIQDIQRWQTQPHDFHPLPSVLVYVEEALNQFGDKDVTEIFWKLSLDREPREKEEEKLARLLHESGFF